MSADTNMLTTLAGAPIVDDDNSLTVGARGPVLLEDFQLLDKMQQFDRERIPERVVHARGMSAKGTFEVTHDISDLTCADVFKGVGQKTPVFVRFSTVIHERGSPETLRDPRGFAVKFYTKEGNWDLVGNNIPVFFIRDGIKFPDMVRALKPNPKNHIQEGWRVTDFFSHHPESMHMFTWVWDDRGIPANYRHMEGFGVHTFKLLSKEGRETLVKFHWKPKCGVKCLMDDEAESIADHSHATRDLYDSIESGDYPEWELMIQTMDPASENKFEFDPLDVTKTWPEDRFPLKPVGRMVLNRNVDNFFNESEQVAFSPAVTVPGITYTNDKLLQSRLFSYADTQRYRLGANYLMLPVNAPKIVHAINHQDGAMNFGERTEEVNYYPSRHTNAKPAAPKAQMTAEVVSGHGVREVIPKANDFQQPGERFRSFDAERQKRFIGRIAMLVGHPKGLSDTRRVWVDYFTQCDPRMGAMLEAKLREEGKEISAPGSVHTSTLEGNARGQLPSSANGMKGVGATNGAAAQVGSESNTVASKVKNAARGMVNALKPSAHEE